jgi:glycine oxidase
VCRKNPQNEGVQTTILGAGLIGASIAWRLAQAGCAVTLIDAGSFGGETSSAGAGMLSPGGEFEHSALYDLGTESMNLYPAFVDELRAETNLSIDFQICGCRKISEETGESRFYPGDGFVDPNDLLRALRAACLARGVKIRENHRVSTALSAALSTANSPRATATVIAAGAWSNQIKIEGLDLPPVKPIKGHLIGFDMEPGTLGPMVRHGHSYVLQRSNGFTIAGSTEEDVGFDRSIDPEICRDIHHRAAELWPPLKNVTPSKRWIGFRPYSEAPHIGRLGETNVWLAYGHFRNGILLAPLTAQRIAADITGK